MFRGWKSRWIVNDAVVDNTGAYVQSEEGGKTYLPFRGWQVYAGVWTEDQSLTLTEGSPHYPDLLSVRSSGPVAELLPSYLGLYRRLDNISHSSRPVWGHSERGDRFLLFQGDSPSALIILLHTKTFLVANSNSSNSSSLSLSNSVTQ